MDTSMTDEKFRDMRRQYAWALVNYKVRDNSADWSVLIWNMWSEWIRA